jgi:hypothetical protein
MTPADRTAAIREPAAGGRRHCGGRPPALPRPLGSLALLRARIKVPILSKSTAGCWNKKGTRNDADFVRN